MAQRSPLEEDLRPAAPASGFLLPIVLCGAIVAAGLSTLGSREQLPWVERVSSLSISSPTRPPSHLLTFEPTSARNLAVLLDAAWSTPAAQDAVPNLAPLRLPPDMDELDRDAKKEVFLRAVLPHLLAVNRRIRADRSRLRQIREDLLSGRELTPEQDAFVSRMAERYRVDLEGAEAAARASTALLEELWTRADVVPPSLGLAQAAIESAWGGSRFARLGNSLFGQWVFSADKGMAPLLRDEGANYSVARFVDLGEAVEAYLRNLNTFWAYEEFRALRKGMRESGLALDSHALAEGLLLYSVRRDEYVAEVRSVLRDNRLDRFDGRRLAQLPDSVWNTILADLDEAPFFRSVYLPE